MVYQIKIKTDFRAAHRLMYYSGKCQNIHGEFYIVNFVFEGNKLDKADILIDFGPIKRKIKDWIDSNLDHAYICNRFDFVGDFLLKNNFKVFQLDSNPSAEKIAEFLYKLVKQWEPSLNIVCVQESKDDAIASYYEEEEI